MRRRSWATGVPRGSMPDGLSTPWNQGGVNNPLILLDEIDKLARIKGILPSALLEVKGSGTEYRDYRPLCGYTL